MNLHQHIVEEQALFDKKFPLGGAIVYNKLAYKEFMIKSFHRTAEKVIETIMKEIQLNQSDFKWIEDAVNNHKMIRAEGTRDRVKILMSATVIHVNKRIISLLHSLQSNK